MSRKYNTRNSSTVTSQLSLSTKRALPSKDYLQARNGPVKVVTPAYKKTKEQRKQWWNSLSQEQQAAYVEKREHLRDVPERVELDIPPLTNEEIKVINDTMRRIGMEKHIVLSESIKADKTIMVA